jgi:hypothetical protein
MGALSHTVVLAVCVDSLEDTLRVLTSIFDKSHEARLSYVFCITC